MALPMLRKIAVRLSFVLSPESLLLFSVYISDAHKVDRELLVKEF